MKRWREELTGDLARLERASLRRSLRVVTAVSTDDHAGLRVQRDGRTLLNFASNDYLALASHPRLKQAATRAIEQFGTGSGASRLVTGHLPPHAAVEARFARFKHAEAALLCPTGYLANLAVLTALAGAGDTIYLDKLCHASLIDAARFSGATVRVYPHLNTDKLKRLLERQETGSAAQESVDAIELAARSQHAADDTSNGEGSAEPCLPLSRSSRRFIVTDAVFSMDGDIANLPSLCDLAEKHDAILIVDEAHGTGVLGESGAGLCEEQGVADRVDIVVSTASKALGGLGGIVTSCREVIDTLVNRARSFIFTTAAPAAQAAAIDAALDVIRDEPVRRQRVRELARSVRQLLHDLQPAGAAPPTDAVEAQIPIVPILTGGAPAAIALASHLEQHGILAPAIRPPAVAPGAARVRLSLRADMDDSHLTALRRALELWLTHSR